MFRNIGKLDRILRLLLTAVIGILYFGHVITGTLGIVLMAVAGLLLLTSLFRNCPLYLPCGIRTDRKKECC